MEVIKVGISFLVLFLFIVIGGLNVQDDIIWLGLCIVLSAFVMHESEIGFDGSDDDEQES